MERRPPAKQAGPATEALDSRPAPAQCLSMPQIRPATPADLPAILDIYNHAVLHTTATYDHTPVSLESRQVWFAERQAGGFPVLVGVGDGGEVLGWASYGPFRPRLGYSRTVEHSVYLAPAAQGQGTGSQLLEALIAQATADGYHSMIGGVDGENDGSIRFHEGFGFRECGRLPQVGHKFGRWLDVVFLVRRLQEMDAPGHGEE